MALSNDEVNNLLNYSKTMVDKINLSKGEQCPDELRRLEYLVFAGMLSFYGFKHLDKIFGAFFESEFLYCKGSITDALKKNTVRSDEEIEKLAENDVPAFFYLDFDSNGSMRRKIFIFDDKAKSLEELLEYVVHEVNHVASSIKNVIDEQDDFISIRTGLSTCLYYFDGEVFEEKRILEEVYNTLQTGEIINGILDFSKYDIEDPEIGEIIVSLKPIQEKGYECAGYSILTPILKPLYKCDRFNLITGESRLEGTLDKVRAVFDNEAGIGAYNLLGQYFDELHRNEDPFNYFLTSNCANILIKQYTK